jgi:hypothetical protein
VPPEDLKSRLAEFVSFAQTLKGDEKSEAQSFLDQFFRALGHKSAIEAGATFEFRVAKKPGSAQLELVVAGNGLEQPGDNPLRDAHARLDAAVRAAYGMPDDADPLAFLLDLNLACAAKEKAGEKTVPPGLPLPEKDHPAFITQDCIQPPKV